jgi:hypothetical protein
MRLPSVALLTLCVTGLLFNVGGCQSLTTTNKWTWPWDAKNKEPQVPDRILPIWTDTIMHQPGKPGIRGFGGRVYFYSGEDTEAIEVDGGLVVYVFDSDKMDPHSPSPEKKYVFTPEHLKNHMSEAPLGKSYSIWLPWDEVGGESRSLTLVTRFEGTKGGVILSQPAVKFLPGVVKKDGAIPNSSISQHASMETNSAAGQASDGASLVQQAGYQGADNPSGSNRSMLGNDRQIKGSNKRRETQTIDLPPSFYRHLNTPPGSPLADPFRDDPPLTPVKPTGETIPTASGMSVNESKSVIPSNTEATSSSPNETGGSPVKNLLRYPFRHIPGADQPQPSGSMETTVSHTRPNRREPLKGGWIESLPKTPRTP